MAPRPSSRIWVIAVSASFGAHLGLVAHERGDWALAAIETPTDMEVEWLVLPEPLPQPEPEPVRETPPETEVAMPATSRIRRHARRPVESAVAEDSPAEGTSSASGEAGALPSAEPSAVPAPDPSRLSPGAVAAAAYGPRIESPEDRTAAMENALNADLYRIANAAAYDTVRPPPELRAMGDGGYEFDGHLFDARIAPDGTVTFTDAPNFGYGGPGGPAGTLGLTFTFDISAAAEQAAGNDPHAAERRWFMDETRRTRNRLAAEARGREQGRGLVRLRRSLREAWDSMAPAQERRRRIFRLWDACEEDEVGAVARTAIVEFVKEHVLGDDAYSRSELASLNGGRVSEERFAPYE